MSWTQVNRTQWRAFTPRDTVFVRDGRPFDASADGVASTVRPGPTTIAGALGAAFGASPLAVRGPVLARRSRDGWLPYFPVPADLAESVREPGRVYRLAPDTAGQTDLDGDLRFLAAPERAGPVKPLTGWMPGEVLARYLAGRFPGPEGVAKKQLELAWPNPLEPERRVGLARDGRTARTGFLYQATHLRPREGWAFLAEYDVAEEWAARESSHAPFGGMGRLADIEPAAADWPQPAAPADGRVLVYLATPGAWADGWRLPVPPGAELVAAATGEPESAATARREQDQFRASRVLRWAVPAGSVYLLRFDDLAEGERWARACHGTALARDVPDDPDMVRTAGFGVVLTGAWA